MRRLLPVVLLILAPPHRAAASEHPLTLAAATARALARNHDIAIGVESVHIASSAVERAGGSYDPFFHLEARYRDHTDPVNSILSGAPAGADAPRMRGLFGSAALSQLLPTGGTVSLSSVVTRDRTDSFFAVVSPSYSTSIGLDLRQPLLQSRATDPARLAIRIARTEHDRSTAALKRTVMETVTAVEKAYWNLVAARRDAAVRRTSVTLADDQRTDTKAKIDAGVLPESDVAQTVAEVERRRGELYAAEESVRRSDLQLKSLMLDDPNDPLWGEPVTPADSPETAVSAVDLENGLKQAATRRPELADAAAALARREAEAELARDRILPQLDLVASYARRGLAGDRNPNAISIGGTPVVFNEALDGGLGRSLGTIPENRFPDASIGLALTLPIGNRTAKADAAAAEAVRRQAALFFAEARQRIAVEVRNAASALQTAAQRIEAARAGREAAETQFGAEKERFAVGLTTNFFVLTRQNELAQALVTESAALTDYRKAQTDFARAAGTLLDERHIEITQDASAIRTNGASR